MGIEGVQELTSTEIDEKTGEVSWGSLSMDDYQMSEDEYLKRWKERMEADKGKPKSNSGKPQKLSFEEFAQNERLIDEYL